MWLPAPDGAQTDAGGKAAPADQAEGATCTHASAKRRRPPPLLLNVLILEFAFNL